MRDKVVYLGQEALHQTVKRVAWKEQVGEGLVRRSVAEEIGRRLRSRQCTGTPDFIDLDEFSVRRWRLYHTAVGDLVKGEVMAVVEGLGHSRRASGHGIKKRVEVELRRSLGCWNRG